jgi:bacteriochlorophyllide a dehydrogenase
LVLEIVMDTLAVVMQAPQRIAVDRLPLDAAGAADVVIEVEFSGISTGTEKLLWSGRMPAFPGMGYPLVPGYESVGRVVAAGPDAGISPGRMVFVPGARCYGAVRGLFGGAARRMIVPASRITPIEPRLGENGVLLALAATAHHAVSGGPLPDLVVGHGVLGRLLARITVALGGAPTVHEIDARRRSGASGYAVLDPSEDPRTDYATICDVSGDPAALDPLIARLARGGEIVLAGFYEAPLHFAFPPAFMKEARIRVAAEWRAPDLDAVSAMVADGRLDLGGLVTHRTAAADAPSAYETAFGDPTCLKMILDWRGTA